MPPILAEMDKRYSDKGVRFVGVCPGDEDAVAVATHAKEFKLSFPVYKDEKAAAVAALKAEKTPEAFVLDHNLVLRYRGRIDDGFAARLKKNQQIKSHDLEKALDEMLAGKAVSQPVTAAVGCPIGVERKIENDGDVTYYRDVLPILQKRCQECHRPGRGGTVLAHDLPAGRQLGDDIKQYTPTHQMPPWKIAEGVAFRNERSMTDKEIATLAAWVDGGTPEGDPKDAPPPRRICRPAGGSASPIWFFGERKISSSGPAAGTCSAASCCRPICPRTSTWSPTKSSRATRASCTTR